MEICIRVDGDSCIGMGHVTRCIVLAAEFAKHKHVIYFLCSKSSLDAKKLINEAGFEVLFLDHACIPVQLGESAGEKDARCTVSLLRDKEKAPDLLVIDHYKLDYEYETIVGACSNCILVIDDLNDRKHRCDILLDSNYGQVKSLYEPLMLKNEIYYLLGADFTLIKNDILDVRARSINRKEHQESLSRALICFGGGDPKNLTLLSVKSLLESSFDGDIDVVIGPANREISMGNELNSDRVTYHYSPKRLNEIMERADFCIGGLGVSTWERCCLGLPSIITPASKNQEKYAKRLEELGIIVLLSEEDLSCSKSLSLAIEYTKSSYNRIHNECVTLIDGLGAQRVVKAVYEVIGRSRF